MLAPLRSALPPDEKLVGVITFDDPETSLWRPFGSRKFCTLPPTIRVNKSAVGAFATCWSVQTDTTRYNQFFPKPFEQWLKEINGQVVKTIPLMLKASTGFGDWHVVYLPPNNP